MTVKFRQRAERAVVRAALKAVFAVNNSVVIDNGGDQDEWLNARSVAEAMKLMFQTDEDRVYICSGQPDLANSHGWMLFIYGNEGHDVLSDYTTNLESLLQPAIQLSQKYE